MKKTGFEMGRDVKNRWPALTGCGASVLQSGCVPVNCANTAGRRRARNLRGRVASAAARRCPARSAAFPGEAKGKAEGRLFPPGLLSLNHCLLTGRSEARPASPCRRRPSPRPARRAGTASTSRRCYTPPPQSLQGAMRGTRQSKLPPLSALAPPGALSRSPGAPSAFVAGTAPRRSRLPPPPREVAGLGSPCKKYSAEITPLAGNASRASSSLGLHNRPDFTLTLSVQAQKALASIGQAINPAERARFKCSRANRRDFPGGARRTAGCAPAALGSGSAPR